MTTLVVALATIVLAEPLMAMVHRFVFHGPLWCEHESHHAHPTVRRVVRNDLLWIWPLPQDGQIRVRGGLLVLDFRTDIIREQRGLDD